MDSTSRPRRASMSTISTARPKGRSFSPRVAGRRRPTLLATSVENTYIEIEPTKLPRIPTMLPSSPISMELDATLNLDILPTLDLDDIGSPFEQSTPTPKPRMRPVSCPLPMLGLSQTVSKHGGGASLSSTLSAPSSDDLSSAWPSGFHKRQPHPSLLPSTTTRPAGPHRITPPPRRKCRWGPDKHTYRSGWPSTHDEQSVHSDSHHSGSKHARKPSGAKEVVYDLTTGTFRYEYRSILVPRSDVVEPLVEYPENQPPLHVDGRMTIIQIPKWKKEVKIYHRVYVSSEQGGSPQCIKKSMGKQLTTNVRERIVKLPLDVWIKRNFGFSVGGFKVLGLEEGFGLKWKKGGQIGCKELFIEKSAHMRPKAEGSLADWMNDKV